MINKKESWSYNNNEKVWVGKYQNSHNISHWHNDCELIYVCQGEIAVFAAKTVHLKRIKGTHERKMYI